MDDLSHTAGRPASQTVALMAPLWATEETVRGHDNAARVTARQEKSAAIVAAGCRSYRANQSRRGDPPCSAGVPRSSASSRIEIDSNTVVRSGEVRWQPALCAWIQLDRIANDKRPYR
jgi:hypothetical protein